MVGSYERSSSSQTVHPEAFARFLALLSTDADEAGHLYVSLHNRLSGFFRMRGIPDAMGATDETIDRAVLNIASGAVVPDVERYCRGIARNVALENLRMLRRESAVFREFIDELGGTSPEFIARIYEVLVPCFEQLAREDQELLLSYCHKAPGRPRAEERSQIAATMKISGVALRLRVSRLRSSLRDCVSSRSEG